MGEHADLPRSQCDEVGACLTGAVAHDNVEWKGARNKQQEGRISPMEGGREAATSQCRLGHSPRSTVASKPRSRWE